MITFGTRVEHANSGQQGTTWARAHTRGKGYRWHVRWDNEEYGEQYPLGVYESDLIEIRAPRQRPTLNELRDGR